MPKSFKIMQWNARSAIANKNSLEYFLYSYNIDIAIISETWFKLDKYINFPGFNIVRKDREDGWGGVAILIRNKYTFNQISNIHSIDNMDVVAAKVVLNNKLKINIVSVYNPPKNVINQNHWEKFISNFDFPLILAGDVNAHHYQWGCNFCDKTGKELLSALENSELVLLNDGTPTYVNNINQTNNIALDITLCSPNIINKIEWKVHDDPLGSNHLPIVMEIHNTKTNDCDLNKSTRKWQIKAVNWDEYEAHLANNSHILPVDPSYEQLMKFLNNSFLSTIPTYKQTYNPKFSRDWWDQECSMSQQNRKDAFKIYKNAPNSTSFLSYKKADAEFKRLTREKQKHSWQQFCASINKSTPMKDIWHKLNLLNNRKTSNRLPVVYDDWCEEFMDTLAPPLVTFKNTTNSNSSEVYTGNSALLMKGFSMEEFLKSLKSNPNTAPGLDNIHYKMLSKLPQTIKVALLKNLNKVWQTNAIPQSWKDFIIIPILKPDKDPKKASSYRPISLSSCILKTFERMIKNRLEWWLESQNKLPDYQFGFRKGKSTIDCLLELTTDIHTALTAGQKTIALFLDIAKAYDTVPLNILYHKMKDMDFPINYIDRIVNLITNRIISLKISNKIVTSRTAQVGLPQGGILSSLLFAIFSTDIKKYLPPGVSILQFADDICIYTSHKDINSCVKLLDESVRGLRTWELDTGMSISTSKSVVCPFSRAHSFPLDERIQLGGITFTTAQTVKFLGIHLNRKLNWSHHIQDIIKRSEKKLSVLKMISYNSKWGADPNISLLFYRSAIRSIFDYGAAIYGEAPFTHVHKLDVFHNRSIRTCLGALNSTPIDALLNEASEPPLGFRRQLLTDRILIKTFAFNQKCYNKIVNLCVLILNKPYWQKKKNTPLIYNSFMKYQQAIREVYSNKNIPQYDLQYEMLLQKFNINTELSKNTLPQSMIAPTIKAILNDKWPHHVYIYTDGSKIKDETGCAIYVPKYKHSVMIKLPSICSSHTAELYAILEALKYITQSIDNNFVVLSDSKSALLSLGNILNNNINNVLKEIIKYHYMALKENKNITFLWIKGHVGIRDNETVDKMAKLAVNTGQLLETKVPYTDYYKIIKFDQLESWQSQYQENSAGKFYKIIFPIISRKPWFANINLEKDVIKTFIRLRTNHGICNSYLCKIGLRDSAKCERCNQNETLKHIILECPAYKHQRELLFRELNLNHNFDYDEILKLSDDGKISKLHNFLKKINKHI